MAAALAAPVAGAQSLRLGRRRWPRLLQSPHEWVADPAVKWGFMTALAGGLSYIVSVTSARKSKRS